MVSYLIKTFQFHTMFSNSKWFFSALDRHFENEWMNECLIGFYDKTQIDFLGMLLSLTSFLLEMFFLFYFSHTSAQPKNKHSMNSVTIHMKLISMSFLELEVHLKWLLRKRITWCWAVSYFDSFCPDNVPKTSEVFTYWEILGFMKQYLHIKWLLDRLIALVLNYVTLLWFCSIRWCTKFSAQHCDYNLCTTRCFAPAVIFHYML